jgi:hypothetical protein
MRAIRFVCLFAILISTLVLAQSARDRANQPSAMPLAQRPQLVVSPNFSQMQQGTPFAQPGTRAFKETSARRGSSPMSGLNFAPAVAYGSGGYSPYSVAVADVNGDGRPDLLVANICLPGINCASGGTVGVLLGDGDGTFQTVVTYGTGAYYTLSLAVADVNGDGKPDLLVANQCVNYDDGCSGSGAVGVLLGNGDGTFQPAMTYASGGFYAQSVAVADVNGDGKPDLLVANECMDYNCATNGTSGVLLGNGDGTFGTATTYGSAGYDAQSVAVGDVNGDGKPDLLLANRCGSDKSCRTQGNVAVLLGNGDGTFQTAVIYASPGFGVWSVAVGDVNGDGEPDLLVAIGCADTDCNNGAAGVLLGNGDGTFQPIVTYASGGGGAAGVAAADVNQDGKPDLLIANFCANENSCTNGAVGVLINTSLTLTTTALRSSQNPSSFGQTVTFTATVRAQPGFDKGTPTGTVSFYDGTTDIGNSNLNSSGVATLTASTLSVGTHSITAAYNGDANFLPSTSPVLYQVVQGAIAILSPTNLNFGNQTVDIKSSPQNVTLHNTGNIDLTITSIQITGMDSGDFGQKNNCPSALSPNSSCRISVTFTPTATGTRNASVSVTDNAPGSPQSVPLIGVGVLPAVTFSPTSLTFPTQLIFTTSPAQPVQLKNTGLGVLVISKITVGGAFIQINDCPKNVSPGTQCTINVKFHPKNKGVLKADLSVVDNAPGSPEKVPLTGTSTFVQLTPTKLNFGTQPVGTRSLPKRIAVTNKGDAAVNIAKISITGTDAGDFAETNNCGKQLASGASCFVKVTFKPQAKGKRTADVSIDDDGGGSPQKAALSGTGT